MSGIEIAGLVLGLIPVVQAIHKGFNSFKERDTGRKAASLARRFRNEATIYDQFVRKVLGPGLSGSEIDSLVGSSKPLSEGQGGNKDTTSKKTMDEEMRKVEKKVSIRLKGERSVRVLESLKAMNELLVGLDDDLAKINRDQEVFEKIKATFRSRENLPHVKIEKRLKEASIINSQLRRLLEGEMEAVPPSLINTNKRPTLMGSGKFLHRDYEDAKSLHDALRKVYACECHEVHFANLGCHCKSCLSPFMPASPERTDTWTFELLLEASDDTANSESRTVTRGESEDITVVVSKGGEAPDDSRKPRSEHRHPSTDSLPVPQTPRTRRSSSVSISVNQMAKNEQAVGDTVIQDICAVLRDTKDNVEATSTVLGILGDDRKFKCSVTQRDRASHGDEEIVRLADKIGKHNPPLNQRQRKQIAFQLCSAVLQLCTTPWIDEAWSWEECCSLRILGNGGDSIDFEGEGQHEFCHVFVTKEFHATVARAAGAPRTETKSNLLTVVAGDTTLTKLGFALIVLAFGKTLREIREEKRLDDILSLPTVELQDFFTAKHLLKSRQVSGEAGFEYANVVKACFGESHTDFTGSLTSFGSTNPKDKLFFDRAEEHIMGPLYEHYRRLFG